MRNPQAVPSSATPDVRANYPEIKVLTEKYSQYYADKTEASIDFKTTDNNLSNKDIANIRALTTNTSVISLTFDHVCKKFHVQAVADLIKKNTKIQKLTLNNYNAGDEGLSVITEAFKANRTITYFTLSGFANYHAEGLKELTQASVNYFVTLLQQDRFVSLSFLSSLFKYDVNFREMASVILTTKNLTSFICNTHNSHPMRLVQQAFDELCELRTLCKNPQKVKEFRPKRFWLSSQLFPMLAEYLKDQLLIEQFDFSAKFTDNDGTFKYPLMDNHFLLLLEIIKNYKNLTSLDLSYHDLEDNSMPHIIELLKHCRNINSNNSGIISLTLSYNKFSDKAVADLADYLYEDTILLYIDLSGNQIQTYGALALARKLVHNGTLLTLHLLHCPIDQESATQFMKEIKENGSLIDLKLPVNKDNTPQYPSYPRYPNQQQATPTIKGLKEFLNKNRALQNDLLLAARDGDLAKLKQLLTIKKVSPYVPDPAGNTPLHLAAAQKKLEIVKYFTGMATLNRKITNKTGQTAQDVAKDTGDTAIIACFTQVQQKLFFSSPTVRTPAKRVLAEESEQSDISPAKKPNIKVNVQPALENNNPQNKQLYYFSINRNLEKVQELLAAGIPIDAANEIGNNCLHGAASAGSIEIVQLAIAKKNSLVNSDNLLGQTPLHLACDFNNPHHTLAVVIELLKVPDYQIDKLDKNNLTPLYMICGGIQSSDIKKETPDKIEIAWLLIKKGANPAITVHDYEYNLSNMSPLHKAVIRGFYGITKAILSSRRCTINAQNSRKRTALHEAVALLHLDIIERLLIEPEINLKLRDDSGKTALDLINNKLQINPDVVDAQKIKKMIEDRIKTNYLNHTTQVSFVKSLDLIYSKRGKPPLQIEGDKEHINLKSKFNPEKKGNQLTASLTFIVRYPDKSRHAITINLQGKEFHVTMAWKEREEIGAGPDAKTRSRDSLSRITSRHSQAPIEAQQRCSDKIQFTQPLTKAAIEKLFHTTTSDPSFELLFHHSENGVSDFLEAPETMKIIAQELINKLNNCAGIKVYPVVVLRIHSKHYLCSNCEIGLLGEQNIGESKFLLGMQKQLQNSGFLLSKHHPMRLIICISADTPAMKMPYKNMNDHQQLTVDLRIPYENAIIERTFQPTQNIMNFLSRKS